MFEQKNMSMHIDVLPAVVEIEGFDNYFRAKSTNTVLLYMGIFCALVTVLAVVTVFFGPDSLTVSRPISLSEIWLLYPGPIASIFGMLGMVFFGIARERWTHVNHFFERFVDVYMGEKELKFGDYHIELISDDVFVIGKNTKETSGYIETLVETMEQRQG